jgi:hypothetical protein
VTFHSGYQVTTTSLYGFNCRGAWTWTWHLAGLYRTFRASVGFPVGVTGPAGLAFLSPQGTLLSFTADGHVVQRVTLVAGQPTDISMNITGLLNFVLRTTTAGVTIAFADDMLTA